MNPTLVAAAIAAAVAFGGAWKIQDWRHDAAELARVTAARELTQENERLANRVAAGFEKDRTQNETRTRTITIEVDKIVDRPVYRNVCLDADGLQLIAAAIERRDTASQPGQPLPKPAAAD